MDEPYGIILVVVRCNGEVETTTYRGYLAESSSDRDFVEVTKNQCEVRTRMVAFASTRYDDGSYRQRYVGED